MRQLLILPHIRVQNANAMSSPYSIGLPAITAFLGATHALQRRLNAGDLPDIWFKGVGVVCHNLNLQTYKDSVDYVRSIVGTSNPLVPGNKRGAPFKRPSFVETPRCHLQVSLVIEHNGIKEDEKETALNVIASALAKMKLAGGDILTFDAPYFLNLDDERVFIRLMRQMMPGHVIIERRNLMSQAMDDGSDAMSALLDHLKVMYRSEKDDAGNVTWTGKRKESGWLVPISVGFQGISELGQAQFQRDPDTPHRFAEAVVTLGEFVMAYRIQDLDRMLWHYRVNQTDSLYLCSQNA